MSSLRPLSAEDEAQGAAGAEEPQGGRHRGHQDLGLLRRRRAHLKNDSYKRIEVWWGGIAWKSAPPGSGLEVDEGSTDMRHASPSAPVGQIILPGRSVEFVATSTAP